MVVATIWHRRAQCPINCCPLCRSCGFSHPRWYFLQIFRISNHQIPSVLILRFFHLHCSRYNCTCCFCFCIPYKYMGRYCPKEWKNRGKVTKKLWSRCKMIILVVKMVWLLFVWDNPLRKARERAVEIWASSSRAYMRAPSNSDVDFCCHKCHTSDENQTNLGQNIRSNFR